MTVREHVANNFSEEEKRLFDFVLSSFPESILVQNGEESEDILFLLAILAKTFGSSRELILNLKNAHDISELYKSIKNNSALKSNNEQLILPLISDLGYHRLSADMTVDELIDRVIEEAPFVEDYYSLYKNRGTILAVDHIVKKFAEYLGKSIIDYDIYEFENRVVILFQYLEGYVDTEKAQITFSLPECQWKIINKYYSTTDVSTAPACGANVVKTECTLVEGSTNYYCIDYLGIEDIDASYVKSDSIIYDMIMQFKPVGILYDILIEYSTASIINLLSERVIGRSGTTNVLMPVVEASSAQLATESPDITTLDYIEGTNQYAISIENNSETMAYDVYVADWHDASIFAGSPNFEAIAQIETDLTGSSFFTWSSLSIGPRSTVSIGRLSTDPNYDPGVSSIAAYFRNIGDTSSKSQYTIETFNVALLTLADPVIIASALTFASGAGYFRANISNSNSVSVSVNIRQQWFYQTEQSMIDDNAIRDVTSILSIAANTTHRTPSYASRFTENTKVKLTVTFAAGALTSTKTVLIENIKPTTLVVMLV